MVESKSKIYVSYLVSPIFLEHFDIFFLSKAQDFAQLYSAGAKKTGRSGFDSYRNGTFSFVLPMSDVLSRLNISPVDDL